MTKQNNLLLQEVRKMREEMKQERQERAKGDKNLSSILKGSALILPAIGLLQLVSAFPAIWNIQLAGLVLILWISGFAFLSGVPARSLRDFLDTHFKKKTNDSKTKNLKQERLFKLPKTFPLTGEIMRDVGVAMFGGAIVLSATPTLNSSPSIVVNLLFGACALIVIGMLCKYKS